MFRLLRGVLVLNYAIKKKEVKNFIYRDSVNDCVDLCKSLKGPAMESPQRTRQWVVQLTHSVAALL